MPSKDILSIREFQITNEEEQTEIYPRSYALPEFFTTNLVHDCRIVKIFTGQNALIRAFYFNYMKLALESEDSEEYIQLLKDEFVSFDVIEEGQLQDKFLSDFQYRKFFKDFIEIAQQQYAIDFEATAKKYPIIDQVLQKLFKTIVPIGLFFPQDDQKETSSFEIAMQVVEYLCQEFQQEFSTEIPDKCIKFLPTEMYLYFENLNEVYIAYIKQQEEENEKIDRFQSSAKSSFVCGEGNSFTSKFQSKTQTNKHPFRNVTMKNSSNNPTEMDSKTFKKTESFYSSENPLKIHDIQMTIDQTDSKTNLLESKGTLIRRRSKNSDIVHQMKKSLIAEPISCLQYEEQQNVDPENQSLVNSQNQYESKDDQRANTLINILDSRVSEVDELPSTNLASNVIDKAPEKSHMITRRKQNKQNLSSKSRTNSSISSEKNDQMTDSAKQISSIEYELELPLILPQPKQNVQQQSSQNIQQNNYKTVYSNYQLKTTYFEMEEIMELGEDQDAEFTIQQFCEVESNDLLHSEKIVNLSDNVSYKLMIQKIQSRNINMSRTSIGQSLSSPKKAERYSFFDLENERKENQQQSNKELEVSLDFRKQSRKTQRQQKSFQQFMKSMKQRLPLTEQPKNQQKSSLEIASRKMYSHIQPIHVKEYSPKLPSHIHFNQNPVNKSRQKQPQATRFESSCMSSGSDEFTKSDILLLLDQEYRDKIRTIKNQYKSTIREGHNSVLKNWKSGIRFRDKCMLNQPLQQSYNALNARKTTSIQGQTIDQSRQRETSIHIE